jgi:hypothetical protein
MDFEREFGLKENLKMAEKKEVVVIKKKTTHIDGGLSQSLEMMMKKNKMEYLDILENLMDYNLEYFTETVCETLR